MSNINFISILNLDLLKGLKSISLRGIIINESV